MAPQIKFSCRFPGCSNGYYWCKGEKIKNKHFYRFPRNPAVLIKWKSICDIITQNCRNKFVCEDHFQQTDFVNFTRHALNPFAVPSHLATESNLIPIQVSPPFENDPDNTNCLQPLNSVVESPFIHNINAISTSIVTIDGNSSTVNNDTEDTLTNINVTKNLCENIGNVKNVNSHSCSKLDKENCDPLHCIHNNIIDDTENNNNNDNNNNNEIIDNNIISIASTAQKKRKLGFLSEVGVSSKEMTPRENRMYKVHRKVVKQMCKLKTQLQNKRDTLKELKECYNREVFKCIETRLNDVTKNFIDSQLRNVDRIRSGRRWTEEDKIFALSLYKRSPRVYRYVSMYFQLPCIRTLQSMLSKVPFDPGVNKLLLQQLKIKSDEMNPLDRYCALLFDEVSLDSGFYYEAHKQKIIGYEDLGQLGRTNKPANHALVFMIRGLRKSWKQVIAYFFIAYTISCQSLKIIIKNLIFELQGIGIIVKATVCDQGSTQRRAITELCAENQVDPTTYTFTVNNETIVTIYDVPHLLKSTRNALLKCKIIFENNKIAKFEHIKTAFEIDQTRPFKQLHKLTVQDFNFRDTFIKMRVKIAARQLSATVAAAINSMTACGIMPSTALDTAIFAQLIDDLFDSLNGHKQYNDDNKTYRIVLKDDSPHVELWSKLISEIST